MNRSPHRSLLLGLVLAAPLAAARAPAATSATPPSAEERALVAVEGHPGAPAVVLVKRATLRPSDVEGRPSTLDVAVRVKILTEAGKAYGQVAVGHGASVSLERFEGVTWRADGRAVALDEAAVFEERAGHRSRTKAAFPAVEVGAILEYRFRLAWTASLYLEPWYFDEAVPVLRSELIYHEPLGLKLEHHLRETGIGRYQVEEQRAADTPAGGRTVRIRLDDLPAVVEEPYGFAFEDLAHRALVVPRERIRDDGVVVPLLDAWPSVVENAWRGYEAVGRFTRATRRLARATVEGADTDGARVARLLDVVRARVPEVVEGSIFVDPGGALDRVLESGRGTYAEVALLLRALLAEAEIPSRLVWAADWRDGFPDLSVVNPGWFAKTVVVAEVGGEEIFLDPGDGRLPAGRLAPTQEGTEALVADPAGPRVVTLARTPSAGSRRQVQLVLSVADDGRVSGRGRLRSTGHHAWFHLAGTWDRTAAVARWQAWLERRFEDYAVREVDVSASAAKQEVLVEWAMEQHLATVLGDEASIDPARPLGPTEQHFTLAPSARRTPVQLSFADRDELELELTWPPGWVLDLQPAPLDHRGPAGTAVVTVDVDAAGSRATFRRVFAIDRTAYFPPEEYAALQALYAAIARHDTQSFVLVAPSRGRS